MVDVATLIKYENKWVAFSGDREEILASGDTVDSVLKKLDKLKIKDSIISFITPADYSLSPLCQK